MRPRTLARLLVAFLAVFLASYLSLQNRDLLTDSFRLSETLSVPLYVALLGIFLVGFLPLAAMLALESVRGDLAQRSARRDTRAEESVDRAYRRAVDLQSDGQLERAARELEIVLGERPEDFSALLRYGEVVRSLGRREEAVAVHQRAAAAHPRSVAMLYQLVDDYESRGDAEIAEEIRNRILRDFPGHGAGVMRWRRDRAVAAGDWSSATRLHEDLDALYAEHDRSARDPVVQRGLTYQRGFRLLEEDRPQDAAEIFEALLQEEPRFLPAIIMLGEAFALQERWDDAVAVWRRGYEETSSPVLLQRIEDHFIEREEPVRAIETLRSLIAVAPRALFPRFFLGRLYYRLEMLEEAQRVLTEVGERVDASPTYHFLIGRIHERRGEIRLAAEAYLACSRLLGVHNAEYVCRACDQRYPDWRDRCSACGSWNSVELAFEEEQQDLTEHGLVEIPLRQPDDTHGD